MSFSPTFSLFKLSNAPANSLEVINSLNLAATIPTLIPSATKYSGYYLRKLKNNPNLIVYDPTHDLLQAKEKEGGGGEDKEDPLDGGEFQ